MKKKRNYYLGNVLIILSLGVFLYILSPIILSYLFPAPKPVPSAHGMQIWIPKIHATGKILANIDPWSKAEYEKALKQGIASAKGFALPGEHGAIYLFAHSSGPLWELTRYNTVFLRLGELEKNDEIIIWRDGKEYTYKVINKKEVLPSAVKEVTEVKKDILIIQTCTPIGTDWKRLLIFAEPVKT